jgi:serine/threonine protein phosphatase PrpC
MVARLTELLVSGAQDDGTNRLKGALEIVVRTDPDWCGQNEDSVFADASHGLAILADGMGGYNAGEVASRWRPRLLASGLEAAFALTAAHTPDSLAGEPFAKRCLASRLRAVNSVIYACGEHDDQFAAWGRRSWRPSFAMTR